MTPLAAFLREPAALALAPYVVQAVSAMDRTFATGALLARLDGEADAAAIPGLIVALAGIRAEPARARLEGLTRHAAPRVRAFAVLSLGDLGGRASLAPLVEILLDETRPLLERKLSVVALQQTGEHDGRVAFCAAEDRVADAALRAFIHAFRRAPAAERKDLLREVR
jgi:HEAT repeat protein